MAITIQQIINSGFGGAAAKYYYDAAQESKEIGEENAATIGRQTAEEARRMETGHRRTEGLARARGAASGIGGISMAAYIASLNQTGMEEMEWLKEVGISQQKAAIKEGMQAYDANMFKFWEATANSVVSLI